MIPIQCEAVSRFEKILEPVTVGIPIKKGNLRDSDLTSAAILDGDTPCPAQITVTGRWEDGSVKWVTAHVLADFAANRGKTLQFAWGSEHSAETVDGTPKLLRETDDGLLLDTGAVQATLAEAGDCGMFRAVTAYGTAYGAESFGGPYIKNRQGEAFCLSIGSAGWKVLENGSVKAVVQAAGTHLNGKGERWMDFTLTVSAWRGKPWLNVEYQFINRQPATETETGGMELTNTQAGLKYDANYPHEYISSIAVRLGLQPEGEPVRKIFTSGFNYEAHKAQGDAPVAHTVTADIIINTANEMFPEVMFSVCAADWRDRKKAVTAALYQAYQNFPKGVDVLHDTIVLHLFPSGHEPLKVAQGQARTSRYSILFSEPDMDERALMDRLLMLEQPAQPVVTPEYFEQSGVFEGVVFSRFHPPTERFLYRYVDSRAKRMGMMHFGDCPEWEYIKQGRSEGKLVWINNEYDMPHNFAVMLARSGDRRYFDYMKAAVEHWYDVDFCHYSQKPHRENLLYTHSVDHVSGQPVPSHQWVEGFLDYYHMTGRTVGLETALAIGESLLELVKLPLYNSPGKVEPREIGWALRAFLALYRETNESRWIEACAPIVDIYVEWAREMGSWPSPYPDNYLDRVPFMMQVGIAGLFQYYREKPEPRVKETILRVVDDMIANCYIERAGTFVGKQAPCVRFLNLNGMPLESMSMAYELTGNAEYIRKGYGMFSWITVENPPLVYDFSKYKADEFTVIYNCPAGPKRCAQSLLAVLRYYGHAMDLGLLQHQ